jgi:NADPH-dependent 2,4-dienoyl-CoA reductase/sulfur reductase-like enzyme
VAARRAGAGVVLLDAADDIGGQYWRHLPSQRPAAREHLLHHGWSRFTALRTALTSDPGCELVPQAQVWLVERDDAGPPAVHVLIGPPDGNGRTHRVFTPSALVLATGAHERTLPFPGWDLPGVFSAGAAQALAKGERVAVGRRVLVAGAGPFLLPVAASLVRTGARVLGVLEASGWSRIRAGWGTRPTELFRARSTATELLGYARDLARHRIPYRAATAVVAAHGRDRVEAVTVARLDPDWAPVPGTARRVEVDAVCVSHGFVPRSELAIAAGCRIDADGSVIADVDGRTSVPSVFAAGEIAGVGGVDLAVAEGRLAGTAAAGGTADRSHYQDRSVYAGFAARIEAAHGIRPGWAQWLGDDTVICRCEEVTAAELRSAAEATGSRGLRSLKLSTRAALGVCQGRMCGRSVEELLARTSGDLLDPGRTAGRPIAAPVRLGELAAHIVRPREESA